MSGISRQPNARVRRELRRSVGFGCPIPDCRSPFLEYHHFDPPWAEENHHRPEGMIPLCREHHGKAAAFTNEQLREYKFAAEQNRDQLAGRFDWLRGDLVCHVGGVIYTNCMTPLAYAGEPMLWFNRDDSGHALLNFRMLTEEHLANQRTKVVDNDFIIRGEPEDVVCPISGRKVMVRYGNGDKVAVEYVEVTAVDSPIGRRLGIEWAAGLDVPCTLVQITFIGAAEAVRMYPRSTNLPGVSLSKCIVDGGATGINFSL